LQDAVLLKHLYQEIADTLDKPVLINEDNQAAIAISRNPQYHGRVKHIDNKYYLICEHNLNIKLEYRYAHKRTRKSTTTEIERISCYQRSNSLQ
uniref:Reverse transcriptase Ty1/copia-type domain-containing protein n=1 Tax=Amphimedon queenslandica TaxID=400682 RepID=A0A1X7VGS7_AMPQE